MSYRSILVYLDDGERTPARVALAAALARKQECHLIGLAPTGIVDLPGKPRVALEGNEYVDFTSKNLHERARKVADAFEAQVRELGPSSFESRIDEADPGPSLITNSCMADLVVIGQSDHHAPNPTVPWGFPPLVLMGSGRPTLVVPRSGRFESVGDYVLVAWDGSREATRAATDALPLLQLARRVELVWFQEAGVRKAYAALRMADFIVWLQRHGVNAAPLQVAGDGHIGKALIEQAVSRRADLIVMGAYGHSRLTELALGGVTRTMLEDMSVPVLMSH
jgi:nucleotide-binding universal stress UspA family protein